VDANNSGKQDVHDPRFNLLNCPRVQIHQRRQLLLRQFLPHALAPNILAECVELLVMNPFCCHGTMRRASGLTEHGTMGRNCVMESWSSAAIWRRKLSRRQSLAFVGIVAGIAVVALTRYYLNWGEPPKGSANHLGQRTLHVEPVTTHEDVKKIKDVAFVRGVAASKDALTEFNTFKDFPEELLRKEIKTYGSRDEAGYRNGWIDGYNFGSFSQQGIRTGKVWGRNHAQRGGGIPTDEALMQLAIRECTYREDTQRAYWVSGFKSGFAEEYKAVTRPAF
jgi:hypothetical protein